MKVMRTCLSLSLMAFAMTSTACSEKVEAPPKSSALAAPEAQFQITLSMKELMVHVIDHAADGVWLHQGWVWEEEEDDIRELFPADEAAWMQASNASATLAEASNLLLLPGRPADADRVWFDAARRLHEAAMDAHHAAEAHDKQSFFDAGGRIFEACTQCHAHYVVGEDSPPR